MGHLGRFKEEFRELARRLETGNVGLPEPDGEAAREGWREILEILYTPEEAAIAAKMPLTPISLKRLAPRFAAAPEVLAAQLETMCDKGLVMDVVHPRTGEKSYLLSPPVIGFIEFSLMRAKDSIPKKRMAVALDAYMHGDPKFARDAFGHETVLGRAMVHETALETDPLPEVLDWQRATEAISSARACAVSLCCCRHKAEHLGRRCGAPMEICLSLNTGAEFVTRRNFGRAIERQEALEILASAREAGLAQIADNVRDRPTWICNCCGCCCEQLQAIKLWGLRAVNPSGFAPTWHDDRCAGCSRCARACPVGAIAMQPRPSPRQPPAGQPRHNTLAPHVDTERCIGCGVCADTCNKDALRMERSRVAPVVPANAIAKAVRQALERNRLADLLFDQGAGLGSRFLYDAVDAIVHLPPAEALLATEQVRSRFVDAALKRFRGMV